MASLLRFDNPTKEFSVVIEDNDKVAYAYLLKNEQVVGDVWLYNCGPAPDEPEWRDRSKMPFANPRGFASSSTARRINEPDTVRVTWVEGNGELDRVELSIEDQSVAILAPGAKPGWCRNAMKDGPLAKTLAEGDRQ
jgi:hypothetical protein